MLLLQYTPSTGKWSIAELAADGITLAADAKASATASSAASSAAAAADQKGGGSAAAAAPSSSAAAAADQKGSGAAAPATASSSAAAAAVAVTASAAPAPSSAASDSKGGSGGLDVKIPTGPSASGAAAAAASAGSAAPVSSSDLKKGHGAVLDPTLGGVLVGRKAYALAVTQTVSTAPSKDSQRPLGLWCTASLATAMGAAAAPSASSSDAKDASSSSSSAGPGYGRPPRPVMVVVGGAGLSVWDVGTAQWRDLPGRGRGAQNAGRPFLDRVRWGHTACVLPARPSAVYLCGGWDSTSQYNDLHVYDVNTHTLTPVTTTGDVVPSYRAQHSATVIGPASFLLFGGAACVGGPYKQYDDLFTFDATANKWTAIPLSAQSGDLPGARSQHTATLIAPDTVLVIGGYDGRCVLTDVRLLHTKSWRWTRLDVSGTGPAPKAGVTPPAFRVPSARHSAILLASPLSAGAAHSTVVQVLLTGLGQDPSTYLLTGDLRAGGGGGGGAGAWAWTRCPLVPPIGLAAAAAGPNAVAVRALVDGSTPCATGDGSVVSFGGMDGESEVKTVTVAKT